MGSVFSLDGPVFRVLNRIADLMWLNILTIVCCLPIVTIGAAFTAQHYVVLKMARNEDGYVTKPFFKSFKQNLKQSTAIWMIFLGIFLFFAFDVYLFVYGEMQFPKAVVVVVFAVAIVISLIFVYVFPVLARFDNTVKNTILNAFKIVVISLPKAVAMVVLFVLPFALLFLSLRCIPVVILFGFSGPAYFSALLYSSTFKRIEEKMEEKTEETTEETTEE